MVAHGSADRRYPRTIKAVAASVRRLVAERQDPFREVVVAYLDHVSPRLHEIARTGDVVVPLLLSTGYHATVDIPREAPGAVVARPLGPDSRLAAACMDRLAEAGLRPDEALDAAQRAGSGRVVLAAAGSSDPAADADVRTVAAELGRLLHRKVVAAYLSAGQPKLAELVDGTAAVATYLLAPGSFADAAAASGVPVVSAVLGDHPLVAEVALDRAVAAALGAAPMNGR